MRILFFLRPTFERGEPLESKRSELEARAEKIRKAGHRVTFFSSELHKVSDFDLIHVFSSEEPETWHALQGSGKPVVVTPALTSPPPRRSAWKRIARKLLKLGRMFTQKTLHPIDAESFFSSANAYLVPDLAWHSYLESQWDVSSERIETGSTEQWIAQYSRLHWDDAGADQK